MLKLLQRFTKYNLNRVFYIYNDATMSVFMGLCAIVLFLDALGLFYYDIELLAYLALAGTAFFATASLTCFFSVYNKIKNDSLFLMK